MKGLAKILFALTLLAVVVGVSYLQTRSDATNEAAYTTQGAPVEAQRPSDVQPGKPEVMNSERERFSANDDTDTTIGNATDTASPTPPPQTLTVVEESRAADSSATEPAPETTDTESEKVVAAKPLEPEPDPNAEIAEYYQKQLLRLPADLTSYEKKVALKEIRDDVCDVFHITPAQLNELARNHKIRIP